MHRPWPLNCFATAPVGVAVLALLAGDAFAQYAVSQNPPMSMTPPTNVSVMMDDSGSMQWAYVPDAYGACTGWRRFNAASFNGMAYNPNVVYPSPVVLNNQGVAVTLTTCFSPNSSSTYSASNYPHCRSAPGTGAWVDGFNQPATLLPGQTATAQVWIDLVNGYQPTASSAPGTSSQLFSPHPIQDLNAIFSPNAPPAGAGNGGAGSNCGSSYSGTGGSGGNQFGPATYTNTAVGAPAYYYVFNSGLCSSSQANDDICYQYTRVTSASAPANAKDVDGTPIDGYQNFANWYSFYRTRHLMIATAAANGMADPVLTQTRVTWRALNSCKDMVSGSGCSGWDNQPIDNRIRTFNDTPVTSGGMSQRSAFYHWLTHVPAASPTPTRSTWTYIGDYFSKGPNTAFSGTSLGANGPYGINPNPPAGVSQATTGATEVACVQNYNITLTDGQWNLGQPPNQESSTSGAYSGTADATSTTLPANPPLPASPVQYTPNQTTPAPTFLYGNDTNHDTLSDIAFHYWATNLRPDLSGSQNAVTPYYQITTGTPAGTPTMADYWDPRNDPATWPHLVQMTIGIGMTSTMNVTGLPWWGNNVATQYSQPGYLNLLNGTYAWPVINNTVTGDTGKAYDLWHAALNSRGMAFSAESASDVISAIKNSLARVKATLNAQSAVATNMSSLSTGTVAYLASYTSTDWHGTLTAYPVASDGTVNTAAPVWTTDPPGPPTAPFAAFSSRSLITSNTPTAAAPAPSVGSGIPFSTSNGSFNTIWSGVPGANASILSWIQGDTTQEQRSGGSYRNRPTSILGDVVDSAPVFTLHENFGYAALAEGMSATPNYLAFLSGTKNSGSGSIYTGAGMLYVGANDGILHGFDAGTGKEVFGYVPRAVMANLPALAAPNYSHQFTVDQTPYVGDACVGSSPTSCTWKTVLVGTTGAGGQGVFALDVTSPKDMESAGNAAGKVLWDLTGQAAVGAATNTDPNGDPDLGYPIGRPMVARLNNGTWAAIFGNGYLSKNGCAVLFIVRLDNGAVSKIGTTGTAGTTTCTTTNVNMSNGLGPVTLYDADGNMTTDYVYAGDLQGNLYKFDLHTAASVPTGNTSGGLLLFSASPGAACVPSATSTAANTCQAITSAPALGPALQGLVGTMVYFGSGRLFAVGDSATTTPQAFYAILDQNTTVSLSQLVQETTTDNLATGTRTVSNNAVASPKMGWYMNLPDTGERVTVSPVLLGGYIVFATEIPNSSACSSSGNNGWIMAVSATGNQVGGPNLSFFASSALGTGGVQSTVGTVEGITLMSGPNGNTLLVGGTQGVQNVKTKAGAPKGRISWHELTR
jgi:type IV pilus assembly protein PilY1